MNENELAKKVEIAKRYELFNEKIINDNMVFDCYGNYYFPTDFSITENNTILSVTQAFDVCLSKSK